MLFFWGGDEGEVKISVYRPPGNHSSFPLAQIPLQYLMEVMGVMGVMKVNRKTRSDGGEGRDATERHTRAPALDPIRWMGEKVVDGGTDEVLQKCGRSQQEFFQQRKNGAARRAISAEGAFKLCTQFVHTITWTQTAFIFPPARSCAPNNLDALILRVHGKQCIANDMYAKIYAQCTDSMRRTQNFGAYLSCRNPKICAGLFWYPFGSNAIKIFVTFMLLDTVNFAGTNK